MVGVIQRFDHGSDGIQQEKRSKNEKYLGWKNLVGL